MKICIITSHYLPHIGGVELATYNLANELIKFGHEVHIITPKFSNYNEIDDGGIILHRLFVPGYLSGKKWFSVLTAWLFMFKVIKCIKHIRPDVIHVQNITNSIPSYIASCRYNIPYLICINGNLELMGYFLPYFLKKYWPKLPYLKHANAIVTLTPEMVAEFTLDLKRDLVLIPTGVDLGKFSPIERTETSLLSNLILLTVCRLDDKKGIEYAIESMITIKSKFSNVKLLIVGDGEYRKYLEQLVIKWNLSKEVEFIGSVLNSEINQYYRKADVFLLPSLFEGYPLVLLEAMACGLPIISTPVSIAPEIINTWNNGYIVPFKSASAIADAVIAILSDRSKCKEFGINSFNASKTVLTWRDVAKKYEQLYQDIII